ncbi:O-antigen ligase family protein [Cryobacterium sp. CG_9.6]|uniref:O-antigen ligase family protein n=1 Tax=Cryobacterium sp. CG_9.6 TaxID=2760710 RepID=UPI002475E0D1|nr:O-antigen ligase family protein [Cryobacterium sp. CG_9.6]MDH6238274.1 O-antigen ligase [Cryobacterium sp. CG_9.6]
MVLFASPSIYIIKPLGAAGTPATVIGVFLLILWLMGTLTRTAHRVRPTPMHWLLGAVALAALASLVAGMLRPTTGAEVSSAERGLIMLASWAGVVLLAADALHSRRRLDVFLRFLVLMASILGAMGLVQFVFQVDFVSLLHLPGLTQNSSGGGLYLRSGFPRVSVTSLHSIEYAAVLGVILPIAIYLAFTAPRGRVWPWCQLGLIFVAIPLTVSRSGMVGLLLGITFAFVIATRRQRLCLLAALPVIVVMFRFFIPGLAGTIRDLILGSRTDQSVVGRTRDYEAVSAFFAQSPIFGRGAFTFLPDVYRTLDNQFLGTLVEQGLVGLLAFVLFIICGILMCIVAGYSAPTRELRSQAWAVAVGITTGFVLCGTFDAFGFPMAMGIFFLLLGAAGAVWQFHRRPARRLPLSDGVRLTRPGHMLIAGCMILTLVGGACVIGTAKGEFEAQGSVVVALPGESGQNIYDQKVEVAGVSDVVAALMASSSVKQALEAQGVAAFTVTVGDGSREPYTEAQGNGPMLWISARGPTELSASNRADVVREELKTQLKAIQLGRGIPEGYFIVAGDAFVQPNVFARPVNRSVAAAALLLMTVLGAMLLGAALRRTRRWSTRGIIDLAGLPRRSIAPTIR